MKYRWLVLLGIWLLFPIKVQALDVDLAENAKSAILIEASTGEIIYQKNAHEKLAPASMTKMMSMLLIIENITKNKLSWDELVTASEYASSMGGSQIFLETGEQMTVRDLLKGISIASGNDATVALAERIGGTEAGFVQMMNERATELGLKNTEFKNTTGLDDNNHYSSANDMALIAKELVKHNEILEFTGTYEDYIRQNTDKKFWLVNTNKLVRFYQGVDGLKTGYTELAGYCLTATAQKNKMRLIAVVMGEPEPTKRNSEITSMLDYGFNNYSTLKMLSIDNPIGTIKIAKGTVEEVDVVPLVDVFVLNKNGDEKRNVTYNLHLDDIVAPVKRGDIIGKLEVIEDNKAIMNIDVTVNQDVKRIDFLGLYKRYLKNILLGNIEI